MDSLSRQLSNAIELDGERSDRSASDSEAQHAVEVTFSPEEIRRRKSSLVGTDAERPTAKHTRCYVHAMLEGQQQTPQQYTPIPEGAAADHNVEKTHDDSNGANDAHQPRHSRLLTKKQLSEMAYGIRELSKKLQHIQVKVNVRNIFILVKAHDESLIEKARELTEWLLKKDPTYVVYVEKTLEKNELFDSAGLIVKESSAGKRLKYWDNELCKKRPQTFDVILSLGGDGTVLYSSWLFQRIVPPVLSFAMGSLGFLTKFDYGSFPETVSTAFARGITVSLRLRFEGTVMRHQQIHGERSRDLVEEIIGEESEDHTTHKPDGTHNILNDIVIDRGPNATMSTLEVFGDNDHFTTVQADGICVATPTGSTAYNLAAGGSLCHPDNPVILLTAICAHTLSFRPIILPDTIVLRIGVPYDARTSSWASFDGRERVELHPGDYVTVSASRYPFPSVLPLDRKNEDWIDSISRTLQWNSRQRQKEFKEWKGA